MAYGAGIDRNYRTTCMLEQKFSLPMLSALRNSRVEPVIVRRDRDLQNGRAYINWAPFSWLALTTQYLYEQVDADIKGGFLNRRSQKDSHIREFSAHVTFILWNPAIGAFATYIYQKGDFVTFTPGVPSTPYRHMTGSGSQMPQSVTDYQNVLVP